MEVSALSPFFISDYKERYFKMIRFVRKENGIFFYKNYANRYRKLAAKKRLLTNVVLDVDEFHWRKMTIGKRIL